MKKIVLFAAGLACLGQSAFAKVVSESAAMTTASNFCKTKGINADLSLSYKAVSAVNGSSVAAYYVFSSANSFVIVSGDDNVTPVLGFSTESPFDISRISPETSYWLNKYQLQIADVISRNITATADVSAAWQELSVTSVAHTAAKTTNVPNLVKTRWNQMPLYNALCPHNATDTAITGCVATAMSQVMRYWKWPVTGMGNHSYNASGFGTQTVNFGATTYNWVNMPNDTIASFNADVATLNYHAGVSVNMGYGVTESGAYVTIAESPITNCAEYALKTYFNYMTTLHGVFRTSYDDTSWFNVLRDEFDHSRPVIYSGFGPAGGHCWVGDGYTKFGTARYVHFNWGWGGYCNGSFLMSNLDPGGDTFNDDQTAIIGIRPNDGSAAGVNNVAVVADAILVYPNPATETLTINTQSTQVSHIAIVDMSGRQMYSATPAANQSLIDIPVGNYPAGIYFVQMTSGNDIITRKVVVGK